MHIHESDLRSFATDFVSDGNKKATAESYCAQLRKWRDWSEETTSMRSAKDFLAETNERSPSVAYLASRSIKAFVKWWAGEYQQNDWSGQLPWYAEKGTKPQRTTTREDIEKMLAQCNDSMKGIRDAALLATFGLTSLRRGEVANMHWHHLDWDKERLLVPESKTGESRFVFLHPDLTRALRRYQIELDKFMDRNHRLPEEEPYVWISISRRGQLQAGSITKLISRLSNAAGIDVTPHSFRRGYAMHWLREGGSQVYLQKQAGWNSERMVARYVESVAQEESVEEARRIFA